MLPNNLETSPIVHNFALPEGHSRGGRRASICLTLKTMKSMKRKLFLAAMFSLMTLLSMTAQLKQQQRACDMVKIDLPKAKCAKHAMTNVNINERTTGYFHVYSPQNNMRKADGESVDTATVTLLYNPDRLERYFTISVMVYNNEWSALWHPDQRDQNGDIVKGIVVKVPIGTYDVYTNTVDTQDWSSPSLIHVDEQIDINGDTTLNINPIDAPNLVTWEIYNEAGEQLSPNLVRFLDQEPWFEVLEQGNANQFDGVAMLRLAGYGNVRTGDFAYDAVGETQIGQTGSFYINDLSDRYQHCVVVTTSGKNGMFYQNRLFCDGTGPFPLKNSAADYYAYEERIVNTPMGRANVDQPNAVLSHNVYYDNSKELFGYSPSNTPASDGIVRAMVNAPKLGCNNLEGVNLSFRLGLVDYKDWRFQVYQWEDENGNIIEQIDSMPIEAYIFGPEMMVHSDKTVEYIVNSDVASTPDISVWKEDYPGHPKFSYTAEQKKGVIGNNCPLVTFDSRNSWNRWQNANMIIMFASHIGRNGELFGSGDNYSTMTAKYNGEEIYHGKQALDSLRLAVCGVNPDGAYELELVNDNVAVDGIPGKNVTTVYFDQRLEDQNPPLVTMLQFRDGENHVTDRFETPVDGVIMFAGGDFDPRSITYMTEYGYEHYWEYKECLPMDVEVSYAPYGTQEWQPLAGVEHQADYDEILGLGFFFTGSLASVDRSSENGWFDLKFRLQDEAGNWQEQMLSPAFRIDALVQSSVSEVKADHVTDRAIYNLAGQRMRGDLNSLPRGIYIVGGKKVVK